MSTDKKILLSIDVGTTNWKVAAFDTNGNAIAICKTPTITHYDQKHHSFYKPEEIWQSVKGLIADVIKECDGEIIGISVTSMAEGEVDVTLPEGWFKVAIAFLLAEWSSKISSHKVKSGMRKRLLDPKAICLVCGKVHLGRVPDKCKKDLER